VPGLREDVEKVERREMIVYKTVEVETDVEVEIELSKEDLALYDNADILTILSERGVPDELLEPIRNYLGTKIITQADLERWMEMAGTH